VRRQADDIRFRRLIDEAISAFQLDLNGLNVLTEAASGPFVCTPLIAATAGASVVAVTRDSPYGTSAEVIAYCQEWANKLSVGNKIEVTNLPACVFAHRSHIVTNLGFVRPIDEQVISALPSHAAISLMWEPWELRPGDIDLKACQQYQIPVVGTRETDQRLDTFDYVGMLALKLLLEVNVELLKCHIAVIGSNPFGGAIEKALCAVGAQIADVFHPLLDAVVVAEHSNPKCIIGPGGVPPILLAERGVKLIHICGNIDLEAICAAGLTKHPVRDVCFGQMTVTTDYVGPKPVVDLHAAGLKVGEIVVRERLAGRSVDDALAAAVSSGLGMPLLEKTT
jgi:hypothetical protein